MHKYFYTLVLLKLPHSIPMQALITQLKHTNHLKLTKYEHKKKSQTLQLLLSYSSRRLCLKMIHLQSPTNKFTSLPLSPQSRDYRPMYTTLGIIIRHKPNYPSTGWFATPPYKTKHLAEETSPQTNRDALKPEI